MGRPAESTTLDPRSSETEPPNQEHTQAGLRPQHTVVEDAPVGEDAQDGRYPGATLSEVKGEGNSGGRWGRTAFGV